MPDNDSILSGLLKPTQYATPEQRRRAQQHAYELMKQPDEKYTSWTQGARDVVNSLVGRHIINQTNEQESNYMKQGAAATAAAAPVPTAAEKASQPPQTEIEGYNGPKPPMHQLPTKEAVEAYAMQLPPEARERYLEKMNELAKPYAIEVPGGNLHANPRTQQYTFQPKITETKRGENTFSSYGQNPSQVVAPGSNQFAPPPKPVAINSEEELFKLPKGTPVIYKGRTGTAPGPQ